MMEQALHPGLPWALLFISGGTLMARSTGSSGHPSAQSFPAQGLGPPQGKPDGASRGPHLLSPLPG